MTGVKAASSIRPRWWPAGTAAADVPIITPSWSMRCMPTRIAGHAGRGRHRRGGAGRSGALKVAVRTRPISRGLATPSRHRRSP